MLISTEIEQISFPSENETEFFESSPMESNPDSLDGLPPACELSESPPMAVATVYTDVKVVPEHDKHELEQTILNLEGEIMQLRLKDRSLDEKRRGALDKILDIKGSIRVLSRVRPFLPSDRRRMQEPIMVGPEKIVVRSAGSKKEFGFDKVFTPDAKQDDVFGEVEPILKSALDGRNVCVIAYGQTGTGKTFTMDGTNEHPGIVPQALKELFHEVSLDSSARFTFSMSMLEVYMGNLRDLLVPKPSTRLFEAVSKCNLNIQTDSKGFVEIEGLTDIPISDFNKASWWYNKGRRARSTAWTSVNEASSRSHCLTRITISRRGNALKEKSEVSKLWMVDLGGSERLLKTGARGQTLDEGRAINLSLSALGDVIAALRRKRGHVPYRNSKLTQILKDSLGTISKVIMLVHVSPCEEDVGETICSLAFAKRARAVESNRDLPEDLKRQRERKFSELEEEMRVAEMECQKVRNQREKAEFFLSENKKLFAATFQVLEDEPETPTSPKKDLQEVVNSPKAAKQTLRRDISKSEPRFMTSTVASRQRQSEAERVIVRRARAVTSGSRNSFQLVGSQSLSYSEPRFRAMVRNTNRKSRYGEANTLLNGSPKCCVMDTKIDTMPRSKMVTSSNPNLKGIVSRHRRRMSDLI